MRRHGVQFPVGTMYSRPSQGTVNGGAVSKWPRCRSDVKHNQPTNQKIHTQFDIPAMNRNIHTCQVIIASGHLIWIQFTLLSTHKIYHWSRFIINFCVEQCVHVHGTPQREYRWNRCRGIFIRNWRSWSIANATTPEVISLWSFNRSTWNQIYQWWYGLNI